MKATRLVSGFALAMALGVSSLAFAQTPPPGYKPSVPAGRMTEAQQAAQDKKAKKSTKAAPAAPAVNAAEIEKTKELNSIQRPPAGYKPSVPAPAATATIPSDAKPNRDVMSPRPTMGVESLQAALAKAYNFNPDLKSFRSRLRATDEQVPQAYAGWLPSAALGYSYGYDRERSGAGRPDNVHPQARTATVTQPIFNGGETIARTDRAYSAVDAGRAQLFAQEQEVLLDAVKAYIEVVRTKDVLELSTNNEQVLKEQLDATKERFDLGETTRTDVAQSEARLARASSDKIRAEGNYRVARANYVRIIGEEPKTVEMPKKLPPMPKSLDQALVIGVGANPSLKQAEYNKSVADSDVDIAKSVLLPDVSARGQMSDQDDLTVNRGRSVDETSITLNVNVPLFQGGGEHSRIRAAKRTVEQRNEEYEEARNRTVEDITKTWRDVETARASIVANTATVQSAEVALEGVKQEADVGSRTTLDVLDAEQELFVSRVNLVTAQASEVTAVFSHLNALGQLSAQNLGLNVEIYDPTKHQKHVKYWLLGW